MILERAPSIIIRMRKPPQCKGNLSPDPDESFICLRGNEMAHFGLLCRAKMTSRELRSCMENLIERQAVICHEETGYRSRVWFKYSLNPVLADVELE